MFGDIAFAASGLVGVLGARGTLVCRRLLKRVICVSRVVLRV